MAPISFVIAHNIKTHNLQIITFLCKSFCNVLDKSFQSALALLSFILRTERRKHNSTYFQPCKKFEA